MTARQTPAPDPVGTSTTIWWLDDIDSSTRLDDGGVAYAPAIRTTTATEPTTANVPTSGFLSRLSQRLVLRYTSAGNVVVDLHDDAHPRQATEQAGRVYVHVADRAAIADLDRRVTPTSLIVISWPPPAAEQLTTSIDDLFLACRLMMTADLATLAIVGPVDPDQQTHLRGQQDELQAAATSAGLHAAGDIIAVHQPGRADRYVFYADDHDVTAALAANTTSAHPTMRVDLFTTTVGDTGHV